MNEKEHYLQQQELRKEQLIKYRRLYAKTYYHKNKQKIKKQVAASREKSKGKAIEEKLKLYKLILNNFYTTISIKK
jgi:hypothetical protein